MIYNQIIYTKSGLTGYAEYSDGIFSRYTNHVGETISPEYDSVIPLSATIQPIINSPQPMAGSKLWMATLQTEQNALAIQDGAIDTAIVASAPSLVPKSPVALTYQQVSFLSGTVQGYQATDGAGVVIHYDADGNVMTDDARTKAGLTEVQIIAFNVIPPAWAK